MTEFVTKDIIESFIYSLKTPAGAIFSIILLPFWIVFLFFAALGDLIILLLDNLYK